MTLGLRLANLVLPGILAACCLALALFTAPYLFGTAPAPSFGEAETPGEAVTDQDPAPALNPALPDNRLPALGEFNATLERPIFMQDRRPFAPDEPDKTDAVPVNRPIGLSLLGILYSSKSRLAVLLRDSDGEELHLTEGESHEGWTLETIEPKAVVFRRGDQEKRLLLDYDGTVLDGPLPAAEEKSWMRLVPLKPTLKKRP